MLLNAGPETWTAFWQEACPENEPFERCHIPADGQRVVDRNWEQLAKCLAPGAQVIDLGCGAGIVGRTILSHRNDLHVTGVDWARVPVKSQPNLTVHTGVRMEALPFPDRSFDAAVSLFGVEYANVAEMTRELARVLKPGAPFSFLVHHREGEIVREGSMRRRALRELIMGQMKSAFLSGSAKKVDEQTQRLTKLFPNESWVKLISDHFRRNIGGTRAERQAIWQKLSDDLSGEISLLLHLERSAKSAEELGSWLVPLLSSVTLVGATAVRRGSGEPIAWNIHGNR